MRRAQLIGMILWRGGLLLAAGWAFYEGATWILRLVEVPRQIEVGLGLVLAGLGLVLVSLILERIRDARAEGDLRR